MFVSELIALLEKAKKLNGDTEVLIQICTGDSFNTILVEKPDNIIYGNQQVIITS